MKDPKKTPAGGRRGAATGKGAPVLVRLQPELVQALDRFIETQQAGMSRPEALRVAFRQWAQDHRLLAGGQEGIRPEDLSAANDD